jgi:hypothetical protein
VKLFLLVLIGAGCTHDYSALSGRGDGTGAHSGAGGAGSGGSGGAGGADGSATGTGGAGGVDASATGTGGAGGVDASATGTGGAGGVDGSAMGTGGAGGVDAAAMETADGSPSDARRCTVSPNAGCSAGNKCVYDVTTDCSPTCIPTSGTGAQGAACTRTLMSPQAYQDSCSPGFYCGGASCQKFCDSDADCTSPAKCSTLTCAIVKTFKVCYP